MRSPLLRHGLCRWPRTGKETIQKASSDGVVEIVSEQSVCGTRQDEELRVPDTGIDFDRMRERHDVRVPSDHENRGL